MDTASAVRESRVAAAADVELIPRPPHGGITAPTIDPASAARQTRLECPASVACAANVGRSAASAADRTDLVNQPQ